MRLRDRIDEYTWLLPETQQSIASPAAGVQRVPLRRVGRKTTRNITDMHIPSGSPAIRVR